MAQRLLNYSRTWHRKIASILFIFFFLVSLTGLMLGWKSYFTKTIYDNNEIKPVQSMRNWLSLDSLEQLATASINKMTKNHFKEADNIQLKPSKGYISFAFKKNYSIQVDGVTGETIHVELKRFGWIQDLHDGAILDGLMGGKTGISKIAYSSMMGLALLFLTVSGFYLWYKPKQIKKSRNLVYEKSKAGAW